ncbi:hypothetical protein ACHWQZ_G001203 [Mnemiopsis leidyi]
MAREETRSPSPTRPGSPNFSGKWRLKDSENFDPFLQDCQVGYLKRTAACVVSSEHLITQEGDHMNVKVTAAGWGTQKQQDYEIGGSFSEVEINGEQSEVETEWEGDGIKELHRAESFEYLLVRELEDEETMVLNLESPKGTKAKRVYKRVE